MSIFIFDRTKTSTGCEWVHKCGFTFIVFPYLVQSPSHEIEACSRKFRHRRLFCLLTRVGLALANHPLSKLVHVDEILL